MKRSKRSVLNLICEIEFAMTKVSRFYLQTLVTRFLQNVRNTNLFLFDSYQWKQYQVCIR